MVSAYRRSAVAAAPSPEESAAIARGDRGFAPLVRLLRATERVPAADVLRLVPGASPDDLHRVELGSWRPGVDWVRAYAMTTSATFSFLFDVWDREAPGTADRMTVGEAVAMVQRLLETPDGVVCPCCEAKAVARKRTLTEPMASFVAWLARTYVGTPLDARRWVDAHPQYSRGGDYAKVRHWGLAQRVLGQDPLWYPTDKGKRWAWGTVAVKRRVVLFRNRVIRFEGEDLKIGDVAGDDEAIRRGMGPTPMLPGLGG